MPCFGGSDESRYPSLFIKCAFPPDPGEYLPRLTEHKIQTEPDDVIDDPSSVFFDPNEKAGFVYTHVPSITFDYAKQLVLTLPECKQELLTIGAAHKETNETEKRERERELSICSDFDDSLERTPSLRGSPLNDSATGGFIEHYKPISRQDSLEFDPIVDGSICQVTLKNKDFCRPTKALPTGLSEDDVRTLYKNSHNSHEPFFIDDFSDMHIYEENILGEISKTHGNKGYLSDAESVKTYQDSGIYDDDIIAESPSRTTHQQYAKGESLFDDDADEQQMEKYSAFKTPLSSRHNSLEYLPLDSPLKSIIKHPRKDQRGRLGDDVEATVGSENDSLDNEIKETFYDLENSERRPKKGDKYSHIQAKVQCFRSKGDKSPCSGPSTGRKTPEHKNAKRSELKRTQSRIGAKPKVDSLSNVKYTPGGGSTKVFKEKLKFRENAQPRTDTHGIEMYAHLPTEFQEIARRLARQDSQLKEQKARGRSLTRTQSSGSRPSSRSPQRGRSRTKKSKLSAGDSISNIQSDAKQKFDVDSISIVKRPTLSRSSSIRSVPSAPKIHQRHPSSSKITRTASGSSQSPSASTPRRDNTPKTKKKLSSKVKGEKGAKPTEERVGKPKTITPRSNEKKTKPSKVKQEGKKVADTTKKSKENVTQSDDNNKTSVPENGRNSTKDAVVLDEGTNYTDEGIWDNKEETLSENVCSLSQYISDNNETFGCRQRGEDISSNLMKSMCQYASEGELFDIPQFSSTNRFQIVPAH